MWGNLGDFYNQISVQILRICEKQREFNGGLMRIDELVKIFNANYPKNQIIKEDVLKAVNSLSKLGTGCRIVHDQFISTVPFELSNDQMLLISFAEKVCPAHVAWLRECENREGKWMDLGEVRSVDQETFRRRTCLGGQAGCQRRRLRSVLFPGKLIIGCH